MNSKQYIGNYGEKIACKYLQDYNYKILDKNFLSKYGEIDIIAKSNINEIVFVEVKTRKSLRYGMPCEAVTPHKKKNILFTSKYYIYKNHLYNINIRYDVIEIYWVNNKLKLHHIKNAFQF